VALLAAGGLALLAWRANVGHDTPRRDGVGRRSAPPPYKPSPPTVDPQPFLRVPGSAPGGAAPSARRPRLEGVLTAGGEPVFLATVQLVERGGYIAGEDGADAEGRYVVEADLPGTYEIVLTPPPGSGLLEVRPGSVTLRAGDRLLRDFSFAEGERISGSVVSALGEPVPGIRIAAVPAVHAAEVEAALEPAAWQHLARTSTRTDKQGRFELRVRDEPYLLLSASKRWRVDGRVEAVPGQTSLPVRVARASVETIRAYDVRTGAPLPGLEIVSGGRRVPSPGASVRVQLVLSPTPLLRGDGYQAVPLGRPLRHGSNDIEVALQPAGAPWVDLRIESFRDRQVRAPFVRYRRAGGGKQGVLVLERTGPERYRARIPAGDWVLLASDGATRPWKPKALVRVSVPAVQPIRILLDANARVTARLRPGDDRRDWSVELVREGEETTLVPFRQTTVAAGRYTVSARRILRSEVQLEPGDDRVLERPPG